MARTVSSAKRSAAFRCSDSLLNRIWEDGAATLVCPVRDLPLIQARVHALAGCYVYGEANEAVDRLTQSTDDDSLRDHGLTWVMMLKDYSDYAASTSVLMRLFPKLKQLMSEWYPSQTDENGLLSKSGEPAAENALYYGALVASAELAARARDFAAAREWRERAEKVRTPFNGRLWNERKGVCDGGGERANYLAILFDVVDEARTMRILEHLDSGRPPVDTGDERGDLYVLEALAKVGRYQQALDIIRRDCVEVSGPTPVYWLMKHIAGIRLPDAEYRTPHAVDAQLCDLDWVEARVSGLHVSC